MTTSDIDVTLYAHQHALVTDETSSVLCLEGGLGCGKTFAGVAKMLSLIDASPGTPGLWIAPTFDLLGTILIPLVEELFAAWGIPWQYRTQWQGRPHVLLVHLGTSRQTAVYLRSGDRPKRIVGFKVGWFIIDEADSQEREVWQRATGRVRDQRATVSQRVAVYTPEEGHRWTWDVFHQAPEPGTRVIDGVSTRANTNLPAGYAASLAHAYGDDEAQRVLYGRRVPRTGLVYRRFSEANVKECKRPTEGEIFVGADFNVGVMAWVFGTRMRDGTIWFFGELVRELTDTIDQCSAAADYLMAEFSRCGTPRSREYVMRTTKIVPDASCNQRRTSSQGTASDLSHLVAAGFDVCRPARNPPVRDRVFALNLGLHEQRVFVDKLRCPQLYRCLTQQPWDDRVQEPDKKHGLDHAVDAAGYAVHYFAPSHAPRGNDTLRKAFL